MWFKKVYPSAGHCDVAHVRGLVIGVCAYVCLGPPLTFIAGAATGIIVVLPAALLVGLAALGTLATGGGGSVATVAAAPVTDLCVAVLAPVVAGSAAGLVVLAHGCVCGVCFFLSCVWVWEGERRGEGGAKRVG